jgi:hypothetical protein
MTLNRAFLHADGRTLKKIFIGAAIGRKNLRTDFLYDLVMYFPVRIVYAGKMCQINFFKDTKIDL